MTFYVLNYLYELVLRVLASFKILFSIFVSNSLLVNVSDQELSLNFWTWTLTLIPFYFNSSVLIKAVIFKRSFLIFLLTYQSVIIVPPKASVDINGANDNMLRDALQR